MRDLELFAEAIEIDDPAERARFLDAACGDDLSLRSDLDRLLSAHADAACFLEDSPIPAGIANQIWKWSDAGDANGVSRPTATHPGRPDSCRIDRDDPLDLEDTQIGPYRLLEKIGEGGFGRVYVAAQDSPIRRKVALKIVKPGMDSKDVIARFNIERQALAMMDHPNIAKVFDGGTTPGGRPYFVMELVNGMPITDYCNRVQAPITERLSLLIDTCKAIQHAHQKGIIHRDIKPSNVMVTLHDGEPVVKVIDFGVAKAINQRLADVTIYTRFAFMIGTPAYMSPEQAELSGLDVDTRCDIFALGVLMYELLTGTPPFDPSRFVQATIDEIRKIIREEEPLRTSMRVTSFAADTSTLIVRCQVDRAKLQATLKGDLDWIVMKAIAKDRTRRYDTAIGLAQDVKRYLDGDTVQARPPSWSYQLTRFIRRNRGAVIALGLVLMTLFLGTLVSLWFALWALRERQTAQGHANIATRMSREANEEAKRAELAERDALANLIDARMAFVRARIVSRRPGQQTESLDAIRDTVKLARQLGSLSEYEVELRSQAIAAMCLVDIKRRQELVIPAVARTEYAIDQNFLRIAYRIRDGSGDFVTIRALAAPNIELLRLPIAFDTRASFHDEMPLRFSPDGKYLVVYGGIGLPAEIWDVDNARRLVTMDGVATREGFDFSPDSARLAVIERDPETNVNRARVYSLPTLKRLVQFDPEVQGYIRFSPTGSYIAASTGDGITIHDSHSARKIALLPISEDEYEHAIAWSPSEKLLATSYHQRIDIWDLDRIIGLGGALERKNVSIPEHTRVLPQSDVLKPIAVLNGHQSIIDGLVFHPQHDYLLASSAWDRTMRLWNVLTGAELLVQRRTNPRFSIDGNRMSAIQAGELVVFDVIVGQGCQPLLSYGHDSEQAAIDPEGRWLGIGSSTGCRIWSLPNLHPLTTLPMDRAMAFAYDRNSHALLVGNSIGLFEWPLTRDGTVLKIGPARHCLTNSINDLVVVTVAADAGTIVAVESDAWAPIVLDRRASKSETWAFAERIPTTSISPNGQWIVLSTYQRALVLEVESRELVASFPTGEATGVAFSPDQRLLVLTNNGGIRFVDTASWSLIGEASPGANIRIPAISRDGTYVIAPVAPGILSIVRVRDQAIVAQLSYPDQPYLFGECHLSQDGAFVLTTHYLQGAILWRLGYLRAQLRHLGLDWDDEIDGPQLTLDGSELERAVIDVGEWDAVAEIHQIEGIRDPVERLRRIDASIDDDVRVADEFVVRARLFEARGEMGSALADWRTALELAPHADNWRFHFAQLLEQAGELGPAAHEYRQLLTSQYHIDAIKQLMRLVAVDPDVVADAKLIPSLIEQWSHALTGKQRSSSEGLLVGKLNLSQRDEMWESIGLAHFGLGDYAAAQSAFTNCTTTGPLQHLAMSLIHLHRGDRDQAEFNLEQALRQSDSSSESPGMAGPLRSTHDALRNKVERMLRE